MSKWPFVVPVVALVALGAGFWIGRATAPDDGAPGRGPAIDVARSIGVAIPLPQEEAFADGEVTLAEVTAAYDRFGECVEADGPLPGFSSSLDDRGSIALSFETGPTPEAQQRVSACQLEHLEATRQTFVATARGAGG